MPLPYEHATSGKAAVEEMRNLLMGFGAASFGVMENFAKGELIAQFEYRGRQVTVMASSAGYTAAWLKHHPWNSRIKSTPEEHKRKARQQAQISVYSILRDWIKGQVTAVEVGMMTFEGAFLAQIRLPTGESVLERVTSSNMLALPAPAVS